MADTAAHLVDRVLPEVPVRQWVLTLPYALSCRCAWNARLTSEVSRCFRRAVFPDTRRREKRDLGVRVGACGSLTFIQSFGSALNLTPYFHTLVLVGVYEGGAGLPGRFHPLDPPETDDVARVLAGTARRIRRRLEILGVEEGEDRLAEDEPLLAPLVSPPRAHQVRYHGELAPCASGRDRAESGGDTSDWAAFRRLAQNAGDLLESTEDMRDSVQAQVDRACWGRHAMSTLASSTGGTGPRCVESSVPLGQPGAARGGGEWSRHSGIA